MSPTSKRTCTHIQENIGSKSKQGKNKGYQEKDKGNIVNSYIALLDSLLHYTIILKTVSHSMITSPDFIATALISGYTDHLLNT